MFKKIKEWFNHMIETPDIEELTDEGIDVDLSNMWAVVVHNDDVNTFENVILSLMEICNHTLEQASQCTMIIHNNGKCSVKTGALEDMQLVCEKLISRLISATVELN